MPPKQRPILNLFALATLALPVHSALAQSDEPSATPSHCFEMQGSLLVRYNGNNPSCPKQVIIPSSVTAIGGFAFAENQLTQVAIPNSVTAIERYAFWANQLREVTIPNSVTAIGASAFEHNQLTQVAIPNSVTVIGEGAFDSSVTITRGASHP